MYIKYFFPCFIYFLFAACGRDAINNSTNGIYKKLDLSKAIIINESATGKAEFLTDEQHLAGNPKGRLGGRVKTYWKPEKETSFYPCTAFLDLKNFYYLSEIFIYNAWTTNVTLQTGQPFQWLKTIEQEGKVGIGWKKFIVNDTTRYLRICIKKGIGPGEVICYGKKIKNNIDTTNFRVMERPKIFINNMMGVNAFVDDPLEKVDWAGCVREYHNWLWVEGNQWQFNSSEDSPYSGYPNNKNKFQPCYSNLFRFDDYYKSLAKKQILISPVLQGSVAWLTESAADKPIKKGKNPLDPFSYQEHADHLFQFAARYGSKNISTTLLKLANDQPVRTGLNYIQYYENWNEPDNWWSGRKAYFTPYELAAMSSADYDGHCKKISATVGIKNADPTAKMASAGLASLNLDYPKAIKVWSCYHRNSSLPFDVINFHYYGNIDKRNNKYAISPEQDSLKEKAEKIVQYRNKEMPDKEVWISEFGIDTHPYSVQSCPRTQNQDREEIQAQWIVRSYLALAAAGVDKAMMYMLRDADSESTMRFSTSGLTKDPLNNWKAKKSWYYIYTLRNTLRNMYFSSAYKDKVKGVWIYQFLHAKEKKYALVIWSPTFQDRIVAGYKVRLPKNTRNAEIIEFKLFSIKGSHKKVILEHVLNLTVRERPIIIMGTTD